MRLHSRPPCRSHLLYFRIEYSTSYLLELLL